MLQVVTACKGYTVDVFVVGILSKSERGLCWLEQREREREEEREREGFYLRRNRR